MKSEINKLLELVKENPDLPVIPMVSREVGGNDYTLWRVGQWGHCEVTKYCTYNDGFYTLYNQDELEEDLIDEICAREEYLDVPDEIVRKEAHDAVNNLDWTKAIIVYILEFRGWKNNGR